MTDAKPPAAPVPATTRGWVKAALVISVAVNLLVIGAIGGSFLRGGPMGHGTMVRELNFGPLTEALSIEDRAALRRAVAQAAPDLKGQRAAMEGDMTAILAVLRAPGFARAEVDAIFARQAERSEVRRRIGQQLVLDLVAAMTPDARAAFADRLDVVMKRSKKPAAP